MYLGGEPGEGCDGDGIRCEPDDGPGLRAEAAGPMKVFAALVALLSALVFAADAHAVIGRADLDGSNVNENFIGGSGGYSVAVGDGHVYWTNSEKIGRADLDGSSVNQSFIDLGSSHPGNLAVDGQYIYWTSSDNSIGRASLDGTGVNQAFIVNPAGNQARDTLYAVAVDSSHIYWSWAEAASATAQSWIGRANLDGTGVDKKFLNTHAAGSAYYGAPVGLAVNADGIYWAEGVVIGRADLDGTDVTSPFVTPCGSGSSLSDCSAAAYIITGLAADDSYIYFDGFLYESAIDRASVDAAGIFDVSAVTALSPEPPSPPRGLAVDSGHIYWGRGTTVLKGSASAKPVQKQNGSKIVVKAKVTAKELLFAQAGGKIEVKRKSYELKDVDFTKVRAGASKTLKLKPKKSKDAKKIAKALKKGKKTTAKLKVELSDSDGNTETEKLSVKLMR